jgi:transcriptional regulator with XRE-family HTH domain
VLLRQVIGNVFRRLRRERGITLRELAELAQVSVPYLSEIERGRKEPSSEIVAAVAGALGTSVLEVASRTVTEMRRLRGDVVRVARPDFARPTRRPSGPVAMARPFALAA